MRIRTTMVAGLLAAGAMVSASAQARGPSVHLGFYWGGPWGSPYYYAPYYPPLYYPPAYYPYYPPAVQAPSPPAYIEQQEAPRNDAQAWWYFCAESKAYYPYVKSCPGGWQRVSPRPSQ
jgi:hypothetical protein